MDEPENERHLPREVLAKIPLGKLTAAQGRHLDGCARCRERARALLICSDGSVSIGPPLEIDRLEAPARATPGPPGGFESDGEPTEQMHVEDVRALILPTYSDASVAAAAEPSPPEPALDSQPTVLRSGISDSPLPIGSRVGDYEVRKVLGQGAMARVYLVRHTHFRSHYALKVPLSRRRLRRFLQEGSLQSQLQHPNILRAHALIDVDGLPGIIMDYVEGSTLEAFIHKRHPVPLEQIDAIAVGLFRGIHRAHAACVVHRDLKPANVLISVLDGRPVPLLADFGLAKASEDLDNTQTGMILGTPAYMPPEQFEDSKYVDNKVDIYALGAILFELCTGERLIELSPDGCSGEEIVPRVLSRLDQRPELPERIRGALVGALLAPEQRTASVRAMMERWRGEGLAPFRGSEAETSRFDLEPPRARSGPRAPRSTRSARWWRGIRATLAVFVATLLGAVGGSLITALLLSVLGEDGLDPAQRAPIRRSVGVARVAPVPVIRQDPAGPAGDDGPQGSDASAPARRGPTAAAPRRSTPGLIQHRIRLDSRPPGAEVSLAGASLGHTPLDARLQPGRHALSLQLGEQRGHVEVWVDAGDNAWCYHLSEATLREGACPPVAEAGAVGAGATPAGAPEPGSPLSGLWLGTLDGRGFKLTITDHLERNLRGVAEIEQEGGDWRTVEIVGQLEGTRVRFGGEGAGSFQGVLEGTSARGTHSDAGGPSSDWRLIH